MSIVERYRAARRALRDMRLRQAQPPVVVRMSRGLGIARLSYNPGLYMRPQRR